ncbi:MAG: sigma-54-dependent Fis family transcriptional regulator [Gemmatimonadetes bacterium]|nr:sigma-54-dependent Fis family transcriptional regulator [Gemmatimonadota bacterium]
MDGNPRILIVDDEKAIRDSLVVVLRREGFECEAASSGEEAVALFENDPFDIAVSDIRMPGMDGLELMNTLRAKAPELIFLLITAHASLETAMQAVREGANDYLTKPIRFEGLVLRIRSLIRMRELEEENRVLRLEKRFAAKTDDIIGESAAISEVRQAVRRIGDVSGNVLIQGESGSGKELVARAVHRASTSRRGPFIPLNCSSIPETLLESELFGYKRGAFTGAETDKNGLFQEARDGTLFLDEVGELPMSLQPKVLRAIETKEVRPLGAAQPVSVDVRIVAATNRDLEEMIRENLFREDLYFRLNVFRIEVPSLRDSEDDIALLAQTFLERFRQEMRSPVQEISAGAILALRRYPWRGNVRELQNVIQRSLITARGTVLDSRTISRVLGVEENADLNLKKALREYEAAHILKVLEESGGDKNVAAERLGISLASLYSKLKEA